MSCQASSDVVVPAEVGIQPRKALEERQII